MRAGYTKQWPAKTRANACALASALAKAHTGRTKILILVDPAQVVVQQNISQNTTDEMIPAGKSEDLCNAIAFSAERIAAVVVQYAHATPYYYQKVRELASAEGALMIVDVSDEMIHLSKNSEPDLTCFVSEERAYWVGSKEDIATDGPGQLYPLPTGQWIYHLNDYETDFVFHEIFVDQVYLNHGIEIVEDAIIFDVGANIGLFSLYIKEKYPQSKIVALEPASEVCQVLKRNMARFGDSVKVYQCGLAGEERELPFHYYPNFSVISGLHANQKRDSEIIMSGMQVTAVDEYEAIEAVVKNRLDTMITTACQMTTLSKLIQQAGVDRIDLLKLDTEGAELEILQGIAVEDWRKIRQIVMEIHDPQDLRVIVALLESYAFSVHVEQDKQLKDSGIYNLFAIGSAV